LGLTIPAFRWPGGTAQIGPRLAGIARAADQNGLASLWLMDHLFQAPVNGRPTDPILEAYSALSFCAAKTSKIKLGTLCTGVTYRHPGLLGKLVTTLDVLSGGRAYLGIGAAWYEDEHVGLGIPFPPRAERFERLEETLQIVSRMFIGDQAPYAGRHYQLARPLNVPQPLGQVDERRAHPPILIGGVGEKKTLRFVAQYGDACNLYDDDSLVRKMDVLRMHCEHFGRPYEEIEKTVLTSFTLENDPRTNPDASVAHFTRLAELGIDHAIVAVPAVHADGAVAAYGAVAAKVADVIPAGR
jgi:F420-dependent oxidoreductase-like protein